MNLYFAPLEGITTYTYRNTHFEMFGGCDYYFAPFITPTKSEKVGIKSFRDVVPENNTAPLIPQLLANDADAFWELSKKLKGFGYKEVNLNLGCPSSTVVKKGRGAGFLQFPDLLDAFLDRIFSECDVEISIKTRTGFLSHDEFDRLLEIYSKYPIKSLTIHPRTRSDFYNNAPALEPFLRACRELDFPVIYNGDIFSKEDFDRFLSVSPIDSVMLGRGALKNPAIFREIKGGERLKTAELIDFHHKLSERYLEVLGCEVYTLHKLKELWMYIMWNFPEEKKVLKAIKKSSRLSDISSAIMALPELN